LPGGQGLGKPAIFKNRATPANPGADADLAGGPGGLADHQFATDRGQSAKTDIAKSIAQKLAAAGVGIRRTSVHGSTVHHENAPSGGNALNFFCATLDIFCLFALPPRADSDAYGSYELQLLFDQREGFFAKLGLTPRFQFAFPLGEE
jgi:hypothetical protein